MINSLTGLRFFAAAAIVLTHSQMPNLIPEGTFTAFTLTGAVPLFFALSGFVLAINAPKYASTIDFYVARVARIWPAHIAAVAFLFFIFWPYSISLLQGADNQRHALLNILLLQAWSPNLATYYSLNAPAWSVSVELFFYLAFPAVLVLLSRQTWLRAGLLFIGAAVAVHLIQRKFPSLDPNWLGYINPLVNLPTFALGVAAGMTFLKQPTTRPNSTLLQLGALALACVANVAFTQLAQRMPPGGLAYFVQVTGPVPFYVALIYVLAAFDGGLSRVLAKRPMTFLGEISYSLYLFHQLIFRWHSGKTWALPTWVQVLIVWALSLAIAAASYLVIERLTRAAIKAGWRALQRPVMRSALEQGRSPAE
ncbi:MAG: hypothetical protein C0481_02345 [Phenylobacterium sp.]|uniref:acyltransferase family protein n=1 Tax=Phenylobacterium sp. TaxID=1871053 RepID=UPI0025E044FD|nr:acyltransferase [Phenylobacterium sp.]MBA4010684.1 hypothetical protein [Phenylobacterium sp.]